MRAPKNPIHPGEILLDEFLKPAAETQAAFAVRLGWTSALRCLRSPGVKDARPTVSDGWAAVRDDVRTWIVRNAAGASATDVRAGAEGDPPHLERTWRHPRRRDGHAR
jgi:hypothetical protein